MSVEIHTYGITHDCEKMEPATVSGYNYVLGWKLSDSHNFFLSIAHQNVLAAVEARPSQDGKEDNHARFGKPGLLF